MRWLLLGCMLCLTGCAGARGGVRASPSATPFPTPPHQTTISACPPIPAAMDDRSTATNIVLSFFNAINRQELARAYNYFSPLAPLATPTPPPAGMPAPTATPPLASFAAWAQGYVNTVCDLVTYQGAETDVTSSTTGYAGIGHGALIPISLTAINKDGSVQDFAGIYAVQFDPAQSVAATGYIALNFSHFTQVG